MSEENEDTLRSARFQDLLKKVGEGDHDATTTLVREYGSHILRAVRRRMSVRVRDRYDSEDFTQAVWASFFGHISVIQRIESEGELSARLDGHPDPNRDHIQALPQTLVPHRRLTGHREGARPVDRLQGGVRGLELVVLAGANWLEQEVLVSFHFNAYGTRGSNPESDVVDLLLSLGVPHIDPG